MRPCRSTTNPTNAYPGFSLIELSIVLVIIGFVAGAGLVASKSTIDSVSRGATTNRMDTLEASLQAYRVTNNRLPCPADPTLAVGAAGYGVEETTSGTCTVPAPAANFSATIGGSRAVEGAVPVRTLNLPDDFMIDGFGRKIGYAVWAPMTSQAVDTGLPGATATPAFQAYGVVGNCGLLTVKNGSTSGAANIITSVADYVLISYGAEGHGGYDANGNRINSGSTDADTKTNAHYSTAGVDTGFAGTYIAKDNTATFDDVVRFKERWQMMAPSDSFNLGGQQTCPTASSSPNGVPPLGFQITNANAGDKVGLGLAIGDINGDGIADLIIGEYNANVGGSTFVIFGTRTGFPDPLPLATLNGTNGFTIIDTTPAIEHFGYAIATGDVNGDGIADIIIGAPNATSLGRANAGAVFLIFGGKGTWPASFNLSSLSGSTGVNGTNGVRLNGAVVGDLIGSGVANGDINGDGVGDVIVGGDNPNPTDRAYMIFGHNGAWSATFDLATLAMPTGVIFNPPGAGDNRLGFSIATGDVNGDGVADLIMGTRFSTVNGNTFAGSAYVVFGKTNGWISPINMALLNGINGFRINDSNQGEALTQGLIVGDVNGDGIADIILGAPTAHPSAVTNAGSTYVLFGNSSAWPPVFNLANLNGINGTRIDGVSVNGESGFNDAVLDMNGDGIGDIIIGEPFAAIANTGNGNAYVVFGHSGAWPNPQVTPLVLNTLNGSTGFKLQGVALNDLTGYRFAAGDINGDGRSDLLIGSPYAPGGTYNGSVYTFYGQNHPVGYTWPNPFNLGGL